MPCIRIRTWNMKQHFLPKRWKISAKLRIVNHHIIAISTSSLKQVSLNINIVTVSKTLILVAAFRSSADPSGHAVYSVCLRPLACWDCGCRFESRWPHEREYYMLSCRGLCHGPITRPGESYRLRCVVGCDLETSRMRRPWSALTRSATEKKNSSCEIQS
jgi:hypothetical protein